MIVAIAVVVTNVSSEPIKQLSVGKIDENILRSVRCLLSRLWLIWCEGRREQRRWAEATQEELRGKGSVIECQGLHLKSWLWLLRALWPWACPISCLYLNCLTWKQWIIRAEYLLSKMLEQVYGYFLWIFLSKYPNCKMCQWQMCCNTLDYRFWG